MTPFTSRRAEVLILAAVCMCGVGFGQDPPEGSPKGKMAPPPGKFEVPPPPADPNALSMEVAALRTLMLLNAWPDDELGSRAWVGFLDRAKEAGCAEKPRKRAPAKVSEAYKKVLTELRAALVANQTDRIVELSGRLDELTEDEEPELDDEVGITPVARRSAVRAVGYLTPERVVTYLNAYGKDFPNPSGLVHKATRGNGTGEKPSQETREFVIREVAWQLGGLDPVKQKPIADKVAALLDKADKMTNEETRNNWKLGGPLRSEWGQIKKGVGPLDVLKHVLEQDLAELLSNRRLVPAMEVRIAYLKAAGYMMEKETFEKD